MSYVEKHLIEGETLVYETGLHWVVLMGALFQALVFVILGVVLLVLYSENRGDGSETSTAMLAGGIVLLVIAAVCILAGIVKKNATEMAVTDKRVIVKVG